MGNALFSNWDDTRNGMYTTKVVALSSTLECLAMVGTQYVASQWIWCDAICKDDERNHRRPPVYLLCTVMFWVLWCLRYNYQYLNVIGMGESNYPGYQIAYPTLVIGGVLLNVVFCWVWTKVFPLADHRNTEMINIDIDGSLSAEEDQVQDRLEEGTRTPTPTSETSDKQTAKKPLADPKPFENEPKAPQKQKPKVDYINNIKIFLTNIVIIHHAGYFDLPNIYTLRSIGVYSPWFSVLTSFMNINQSYFMGLFFFLSGYFVPKSYDKKGMYSFLFERFKRLGIPFVFTVLFLSPYIQDAINYAMNPEEDKTFRPSLDGYLVTWFLLTLLLFSCIYAIVCGKGWNPRVKCPSMTGFFGIALCLGLVISTMSLFVPNITAPYLPEIFGIPFSTRQSLQYVAMFFGGGIAQRNNWMEKIKEKSKAILYTSPLLLAILIAASANFEMFTRLQGDPDAPTWYFAWGFAYFDAFLAPFVMVFLSLAVTVFFMNFVNRAYFCTPFFSKSMYTAYIIHYPIVKLVQWAWIAMLKSIDSVEMYGNLFVNPNLYFPSFLFMAFFGLLLTWPLAYGIVSIPGFSQVL